MKRVFNIAGWPVLFFLVVMVVWHGCTRLFHVPTYVLPSPVDVAEAIRDNAGELFSATRLTALAALAGFGLSLTVGVAIALLFAQSRIIRSSCYPYAIFLQTVPIVAIAPLIMIWFGTGFHSVVIVSFIVSLFPIIANTTTGLTTVDRQLADLFALYRTSRAQTAWKLMLPGAIPYLIAGAKTASGMAVIGAIVGEFFAGYGADIFGLGYLITITSNQLKTAYLFASLFACTVLGLAIFSVVSIVGSLVLRRWYQDKNAD